MNSTSTTHRTAKYPTGQHVGYVRVSTTDQNTQRQLEGVVLDKVFTDKASGKDRQRPQLGACLSHLREGDTLHVHSMDRLARNLDDLRKIVDELTARGVAVAFSKEGMTFEPVTEGMERGKADMARLMLSIMGAVAEFERSMILERQREGIAIAKAEGRYKGAKPKLTEAQAQELKQRAAQGVSKSALAKDYGVSRETVYTYLREGPQKAL
ncbi:recombinase family protein [Acidovorax sp. SRB_24]|uniref:recombinase family protein n=1 Tax=Acidovorax sp. SRB_24 TaxID=1962700 RepID=UPI00145E45F7|nr:recombinase family protein [Acidovorax sp. SRB_24]NMM76221.1 transposase [Acidovorax sp. SRB_24]